MDLRKLKTLIDLVSESNVSELEITEAEGKVRIVKTPGVGAVAATPHAFAASVQPVVAMPVAAATPVEAVAAPAPAVAAEGKVVKSPMVGTFYQSASPGAAAFADVGTEVKLGDTVCIVEAMKIMNEIESEVAGRVVKVLVSNGAAVEYGQPLFVLE